MMPDQDASAPRFVVMPADIVLYFDRRFPPALAIKQIRLL